MGTAVFSRCVCQCLLLFRSYTPLLAGEAAVVVVAPLGVVLGGSEELGSLGRILLLYAGVADLALEEVLEEAPVGFLAVECEGVLAFALKHGVVAPEVPVAACHGALLFLLAVTHAGFEAVGDTGRVGDDERRAVVGFSLADGLESLL